MGRFNGTNLRREVSPEGGGQRAAGPHQCLRRAASGPFIRRSSSSTARSSATPAARCAATGSGAIARRDMTLDADRARLPDPALEERRDVHALGRRADDQKRHGRGLAGDPRPAAEAAEIRHQHHRPDAASRDPDDHQGRRACHEKGVIFSTRVSIDGVGEMHNEVRQVKNGFDKANETITAMRELQKRVPFNFGVSATIFNKNIDDCREHPRLGEEGGPRHRLQHGPLHRSDARQRRPGEHRASRSGATKSGCASSSSSACGWIR